MPDEPESKPAAKQERRVFYFTEIRMAPQKNEPDRLTGHAAVFNSLSEDLGGFRETIRPGAFTRSIKDNPDIYALQEHDSRFPLARTGNGSLFLKEDRRGLAVDIRPTDTSYARDLMLNVREDLINKMSFAFSIVQENWTGGSKDQVREVQEVNLYEVSPVTFPAYSSTDLQARSALSAAGLEFEPLGGVLFKARHQVPLTTGERDLVKRSIQILTAYLTPEPSRTGRPEAKRTPLRSQKLTALQARLEKASRI